MKQLGDLFHYGESPYIACFVAGKIGYTLEEVMSYCLSIGIQLRRKDCINWRNGHEQQGASYNEQLGNLAAPTSLYNGKLFEQTSLEDFPQYPYTWVPPENRFFPCTQDNRPIGKWGWSSSFVPNLYPLEQAVAMSPCGWIGQNMLYQRFIVVDIDGVGHGAEDPETIAFGNQFKHMTLTYEDPAKVGSYHLYFATDRIIPIKHFPWAHIDLMGNQRNAAVYFKNKQSNHVPIMKLTNAVWHELINYQQQRKVRC